MEVWTFYILYNECTTFARFRAGEQSQKQPFFGLGAKRKRKSVRKIEKKSEKPQKTLKEALLRPRASPRVIAVRTRRRLTKLTFGSCLLASTRAEKVLFSRYRYTIYYLNLGMSLES